MYKIRFFVLLALLMGWISPIAQGQTTPPATVTAPVKATSATQTIKRANLGLSATPAKAFRILVNTPYLKEIDADASLAFKSVGVGDDAEMRPFWFGQADFLAVGKYPDSDADLFPPQQYLWTVVREPIVPLALPPAENPPLARATSAALVVAGTVPQLRPVTFAYTAWQETPPWARDGLRLSLREAVGLEETGADGRPLAVLKPSVSRPDKHFYWDLDSLTNATFPQTTTTQVEIRNEARSAPPLIAKINWHMPTYQVWEVELDLWNWVGANQAPPANISEWWDKVLTDEELQKEILTDVALKGAEVVVDRGAERGGKIVVRLITAAKTPAKAVAQRVLKAALRVTQRQPTLPDGTLAPSPTWFKQTKVRVKARDLAPERAPELDPDVSVDFSRDRQEQEEDYIESDAVGFYLYYTGANPTASHWPGATSGHPNELARRLLSHRYAA